MTSTLAGPSSGRVQVAPTAPDRVSALDLLALGALLHVALLGTTTMGFPAMMRGRSWVLDVLDGKPGMEK